MKKNYACPKKDPARLNLVGGEAVIEGVMMKAGQHCPTACRLPNGKIAVKDGTFVSIKEKHKWAKWPIIRGLVGFAESLKLSYGCMMISAELYGDIDETENEKESRFFDVAMVISLCLGLLLALGLFLFLPNLLAQGVEWLIGRDIGLWKAVISGVVKVFVFVVYILLVSLMKDIRRTFQYHGAEHKSIACFEAGEELTPANAKKYNRFHPRCGTSFMFVMILLGIIFSLAIRSVLEIGFQIDFEVLLGHRFLETLIYTALGLITLPLVVGVGYEFLMYAGKHDNAFIRALSAPGLLMQRLTTREPDEEQLEVAITALKYALVDTFPDFDRSAYDIEKVRGEDAAASVTETAEATDGEADGDGHAIA